ncbi:type VI secretion system baseplate subunit TssF [Ideonella sp. DXS29W]|uniref:Type VI secretion system baseplate subunit TssF n=1 Tax=Ideonella lacteola TaxID=2984193 RepID=A0ABU9BS32_9BURK
MNELLPHYERELAFLRAQADDFARQFPRIAGRLSVSGEVMQDPHVERLIQSFALLTSRIHKRLADDFPLFTESFLELLYPHYLRPFPSCSIAQFDLDGASGQFSSVQQVERGTALASRVVRGVTCKFTTTQALELAPIQLTQASFRAAIQVPEGTRAPRQATAMLSVHLKLVAGQAKWADLGLKFVRVYLDGSPSQVTALRETLIGRTLGTMVQTTPHGPWLVDAARPQPVGLDDDQALVEFDARSHPAYRLLTEYFAFPDKFNFVDLPLPEAALRTAGRTLVLHFPLAGLRGDSDDARLLEVTEAQHLQLHCVPVINLYATPAEPIRISHATTTYPVLPDARHAYGHEVYAIDKVYCIRQTADGESIHTFAPFYSLQHRDLLQRGDNAGCYWFTQRDSLTASQSPGYETEIGIVDASFDPVQPQAETLSIQVRATNRDLPSLMGIGNPGGDLFMNGGGPWNAIRLLRKPTPTYRFEREGGALWRLISHLSLNHLSLSGGGLDALKEMLRLYDLPRSPENARMLDGLVSIEFLPANACLPGNPFPTFVRGTEVRLTVNEQHFVGSGLQLFTQVMDRFFGLYAHLNSFTQLKVLSARTHAVLIDCPRRTGDRALV